MKSMLRLLIEIFGAVLLSVAVTLATVKIMQVRGLEKELKATQKMLQATNEKLAELCAKHPDRFIAGVANLPMSDIDEALKEAERAITSLGLKGVLIYSNINGKPLDSPEFMPLYAMMARFDLPIWIHPHRHARLDAHGLGDGAHSHQLFGRLDANVQNAGVQGGANFIVGGARVGVQRRLGGQHHAAEAIAALCRPLLDKGLLKRVWFFEGAEAFECGHRVALDRTHRRHAGAPSGPVDQYSTRAALCHGAAILGAIQLQIVTQHIEQRCVWLRINRAGYAIDLQVNQHSKCP